MKPVPDKPIRLGKPLPIEQQISRLPMRTDYQANRYDTDNETILHLWDSDGHSYDVRFTKQPKPVQGWQL